MCQQAGRCVRWQTQAAVTAGGCWLESLRHLSHPSRGTKSGPVAPSSAAKRLLGKRRKLRRRTRARASVAEVAQVIIRLVRQIKPRPSCLCARRSRALVCDAALRCYNLLPALILRVDPLHAALAIRSFFLQKGPEGSTYSTVLFALHALSVLYQTFKPRWHCGSHWRGSRVSSTQSQSIHRIRKYLGCKRLQDLIGHWTRQWTADRKVEALHQLNRSLV